MFLAALAVVEGDVAHRHKEARPWGSMGIVLLYSGLPGINGESLYPKLTLAQIWQLTDELIQAEQQWLPDWLHSKEAVGASRA